MPSAGYELGRLLYAPLAVCISPVGSVVRTQLVPLALERQEALLMAAGRGRFDYADMAMRLLPAYLPRRRRQWREFMRPAQVDRWGRTNNVAIGPYEAPRVRLPGAVGLPDGTPLEHEIQMYVPRHDRRTFVTEVDFVCTRGMAGSEKLHPGLPATKPGLVVTDLGVFRYVSEVGLVCESLHAGVTLDEARFATSFEINAPDGDLPTTPTVTPEERDGLDQVDPMGLRRLEMLPGRARRQLLRDLILTERRGTEAAILARPVSTERSVE